MSENDITGDVLDAAIKIHRRFVNGFNDNNSQRLCLSASLRETDSSQESVI